jgi:hypothetical protein
MKRLCTLISLTLLLTATTTQAAQVLFIPELMLSQEYSDNIFLTPVNETDDFITQIGLNLTGQILGRTSGLELTYMPSFNKFADNEDLDYWRNSARLSAWNDISRTTRFEFTNTYLETEDPRDNTEDLTPVDPLQGPVINVDLNRRGRNRYRQNVAQARLSNQFGANDLVYAEMEYSLLREIDTPAGQVINDYDNLQPSFGLNYRLSAQWGIELAGYYSNRDYVDQNDREEYSGNFRLLHNITRNVSGFIQYSHTLLDYDQETDEDYQIYEPSIGFRYQYQETAYISLAGGYYIQKYDRSEEDEEEGFNINSVIYKSWEFRTGRIGLTGSSGYEIDDTGTEDLGLNIYYQARLDLLRNLSPKLAINAFGGYRYDDYPNETPERSDKTLNAGAGLIYQALQWMNIGLTYAYNDVSSDLEAEEYTENSIILTITMTPTTPFRLN